MEIKPHSFPPVHVLSRAVLLGFLFVCLCFVSSPWILGWRHHNQQRTISRLRNGPAFCFPLQATLKYVRHTYLHPGGWESVLCGSRFFSPCLKSYMSLLEATGMFSHHCSVTSVRNLSQLPPHGNNFARKGKEISGTSIRLVQRERKSSINNKKTHSFSFLSLKFPILYNKQRFPSSKRYCLSEPPWQCVCRVFPHAPSNSTPSLITLLLCYIPSYGALFGSAFYQNNKTSTVSTVKESKHFNLCN